MILGDMLKQVKCQRQPRIYPLFRVKIDQARLHALPRPPSLGVKSCVNACNELMPGITIQYDMETITDQLDIPAVKSGSGHA